MRPNSASALLIALALPACADSATQLPATTKILGELPRVQNSSKAPCWQQIQIAKQNAYIDSIKSQQELIYTAPCQLDQKIASAKP